MHPILCFPVSPRYSVLEEGQEKGGERASTGETFSTFWPFSTYSSSLSKFGLILSNFSVTLTVSLDIFKLGGTIIIHMTVAPRWHYGL